jgi:hypothetical protein
MRVFHRLSGSLRLVARSEVVFRKGRLYFRTPNLQFNWFLIGGKAHARCGCGEPNIEDRVRVANQLLAGLSVTEDPGAAARQTDDCDE